MLIAEDLVRFTTTQPVHTPRKHEHQGAPVVNSSTCGCGRLHSYFHDHHDLDHHHRSERARLRALSLRLAASPFLRQSGLARPRGVLLVGTARIGGASREPPHPASDDHHLVVCPRQRWSLKFETPPCLRGLGGVGFFSRIKLLRVKYLFHTSHNANSSVQNNR